MPFKQSDTIRYYTFDSLEDSGVNHAVFTRRGGVSPDPWASLNVGGTVGDDPARVYANRIRSLLMLDCDPQTVFDVWQVHGNNVVSTDGARNSKEPYQKADAIITNRESVTLFMRFADCVPILLHDPIHKVVGLVHAGWKGTINGVITSAIKAMKSKYRSNPRDILAGIGPSIGPHHYEIGGVVAGMVKQVFGDQSNNFLTTSNGKYHFDLWGANTFLLLRSGVKEIEQSGICTACHLDDWYSHRAEKGKTGRFGVLIHL